MVSFSSVLGAAPGPEEALNPDTCYQYSSTKCFVWYKRELIKPLPSKALQSIGAGQRNARKRSPSNSGQSP